MLAYPWEVINETWQTMLTDRCKSCIMQIKFQWNKLGFPAVLLYSLPCCGWCILCLCCFYEQNDPIDAEALICTREVQPTLGIGRGFNTFLWLFYFNHMMLVLQKDLLTTMPHHHLFNHKRYTVIPYLIDMPCVRPWDSFWEKMHAVSGTADLGNLPKCRVLFSRWYLSRNLRHIRQ